MAVPRNPFQSHYDNALGDIDRHMGLAHQAQQNAMQNQLYGMGLGNMTNQYMHAEEIAKRHAQLEAAEHRAQKEAVQKLPTTNPVLLLLGDDE